MVIVMEGTASEEQVQKVIEALFQQVKEPFVANQGVLDHLA